MLVIIAMLSDIPLYISQFFTDIFEFVTQLF